MFIKFFFRAAPIEQLWECNKASPVSGRISNKGFSTGEVLLLIFSALHLNNGNLYAIVNHLMHFLLSVFP
jgi:hypothetical protein